MTFFTDQFISPRIRVNEPQAESKEASPITNLDEPRKLDEVTIMEVKEHVPKRLTEWYIHVQGRIAMRSASPRGRGRVGLAPLEPSRRRII